MKERKKRTTIKEAFDEGYNVGKKEVENIVFELIESTLEDFDKVIEMYPRNTKFVEIEIETIEEFREKLKYALKHKDV
jgi:hypothetical protein